MASDYYAQLNYERWLKYGAINVSKHAEKTGAELVQYIIKKNQDFILQHGPNIIGVKRVNSAFNNLQFDFVAKTQKGLDTLIGHAVTVAQQAKAEGLKSYFTSVGMQYDSLPNKVKQPITAMFGGGFSNEARKLIEATRAKQGIDLSKSIWNITQANQRMVWNAVYDGLQNNETLQKITGRIARFATAKGKANLMFNIRRLYVSEANNAFLRTQEYLTKKMPFVNKVKLCRGADGDPKCPICAANIGAVGTCKIETVQNALYPPYHPFCKCTYYDILPTKKEMLDYINNGGKFTGTGAGGALLTSTRKATQVRQAVNPNAWREFDNVKDARKWLRNRLKAAGFEKVSVSKFDADYLNSLNQISKALDEMLNKMKLPQHLKEIEIKSVYKIAGTRDGFFRALELDVYNDGKPYISRSKIVYGLYTDSDAKEMAARTLKSYMDNPQAIPWFSYDVKNLTPEMEIHHTVWHEMGHALASTKKKHFGPITGGFWKGEEEQVAEHFSAADIEMLNKVSEYGQTNYAEGWAESFAAISMKSPRAKYVPQQFIDLYNKYVKLYFKKGG